jgi:nucleotide-binding universal stress UspA family protein
MTEKMKILIAYDGSDCAEAALDDLQRAGLPAEAEALIMSVVEVWLPPPPPSAYEIVEQATEAQSPTDLKRMSVKGAAEMKAAEELAALAGRRVHASFPKWTVTSEASCGSPAYELVTRADKIKSDLLVVGSHGRGALGRLLMGSVSQRVVTEARCSVRVARGRVEEADTPVRILIGVDGSPASETAVHEVAARVWPNQSEIHLLVVDDPLAPMSIGTLVPAFPEAVEESAEEERHWAEDVLDSYAAMLSPSGIKVTKQIARGDPKRVLVEAAEQWRADCIFVGSTGFSNRLERFVLGSVSAAVVAHAHCSVEVVRK